MNAPTPRRPGLWSILGIAALLTLPVAKLLDRPIERAGGAVLCPRTHSTLIVRVARDLTRDQRYIGSSTATSLCAAPATVSACRWGRPSCRGVPVSTVATYATLLGIAFVIAVVPAAAFVALRRRSRR